MYYGALFSGTSSTCFQVQAARTAGESVAEYACQRVTLLHHRNKKFTVRIKAYDIS